MSDICYLCGLPINTSHVRTNDHVVPATLITRTQPKAKGFDYGSFLPTHNTCNNRFGDETYVSKALDLLSVLNDPSAGGALQHVLHEEIIILPVDASKLPYFTKRDLQFFKINDARAVPIESFSNPEFYAGQVKANPNCISMLVALNVLAKSAAALLVKRHLDSIPNYWRIYANPYSGDTSGLDFAELVGVTRPFDTNLRIWVAELPNSNWHVIYAAKDALVFFTFAFSNRARLLHKIKTTHSDADTLKFMGTSINELLVSGWHKV
jgi:hypothetical protein